MLTKFVLENLNAVIAATVFVALAILYINSRRRRVVDIRPNKKGIPLIHRFTDIDIVTEFAPPNDAEIVKSRSSRLFKNDTKDNSGVHYEEMTSQERHDAGFRKVG